MLNRVRLWLRSALLRRRLERDMQHEMAEHMERATALLVQRGLPAGEARQAALREFGNVPYLQEQARDARGARWLDELLADARFARRHFGRNPFTSLTMFAVLAAGIAITTLLFSFVHSYASAPPRRIVLTDDLVRIRGSRAAGGDGRAHRTFSEEEFLQYAQMRNQFAAVAGWTEASVSMVPSAARDRVGARATATFVSADYFAVLGIQPARGAGLPDESSEAAVAIINDRAWDQLFASDPRALGSTLTINNVPFTITGIAPAGFRGAGGGGDGTLRVWLPLSARRLLGSTRASEFEAAARLAPGVDAGDATAAVQVVAARVAAENPRPTALEPSTDIVPLLALNSDPMFARVVNRWRLIVGVFALLVLAVTVTNVSSLLTGLATVRAREIAVRLSLGANRKRLLRQLLTESVVLATAAAAGAVGLVWAVMRFAIVRVPEMPFDFGVTWPATIFAFSVALAVGIVFGLSPALHATRLGLAHALRNAAGNITAARGRLQRGLVVAQIALTQPLIVLLVGVLLLLFVALRPQRRTEHADRIVAVHITPSIGSETDQPGSGNALPAEAERLRERLLALPGVTQAIVTWQFSQSLGSYAAAEPEKSGSAAASPVRLTGEWVARGYFDVMGVRIVRGRDFGANEVSSSTSLAQETPVIISSDLARTLWRGVDPLGRRLEQRGDSITDPRALIVVGLIDDPLAESRKPGEDYRVYFPADRSKNPWILLRTAEPAQPLLPAIRKIVQSDLRGMLAYARTLADAELRQQRYYRLATSGFSAAGAAAMLLSAIGLYAVVAFSVAQRTREIAVRLAVGGRAGSIVRGFMKDGLKLTLFGLVIGMPLSLLGLRLLVGFLRVPWFLPLPPVAAIGTAGVFLVATLAAWLPARAAASVDPAITLRAE